MALNLNSKCKDRLKQSLSDILSSVIVDNDIFLNVDSTFGLSSANKILPRGKVLEKLYNYIGEDPIFIFVFETISRDLSENGTYNSDKIGIPLKSLSNYSNLVSVADHVVNEFENLPWSFSVSFELPGSIGKLIKEATNLYCLNPSLKIVTPDINYDSQYPLYSGITQRDDRLFGGYIHSWLSGLLSGPKEWNRETAYIQIETQGFIGRFFQSTPLDKSISLLKAFIGLSLATRFMKIEHREEFSSFGVSGKSHLIVHRKFDEKWQIWSTYELSADLSNTIAKLRIEDLGGSLSPDKTDKWIQSKLPTISIAFQNYDKAEQVLLAAEWLLDSYVGNNELLSFVQTTVAMEIMLGEESKSDVLGIGELIRNRCAYLIGKSRSQRDDILKDFSRIYEIRSKIVHRGKKRLTEEEGFLLEKLRWMCRRVISEELNLISKDKSS